MWLIVTNFLELRVCELRRIPTLRLSEKGLKSLQCSLTEHRNGTFRPILASLRLPNPRSECCSYPFSDSFCKVNSAKFACTECLEVRVSGQEPGQSIVANAPSS